MFTREPSFSGPCLVPRLSHTMASGPKRHTFVVNSEVHGLVIVTPLINTGQVEGNLRVTVVFRSSYS